MSPGRKFGSTTDSTPETYSWLVFQTSGLLSTGSGGNENVPVRMPQSRMSNLLPAAGEKPPKSETLSVPPSVALLLQTRASYWLPRTTPASSTFIVAPLLTVSDETVRTPGLSPGEMAPPLATVTAPQCPMPLSIPPEF